MGNGHGPTANPMLDVVKVFADCACNFSPENLWRDSEKDVDRTKAPLRVTVVEIATKDDPQRLKKAAPFGQKM